MVTFHIILLELICARQLHGTIQKRGKYFWKCWMIVWTKSGRLHLITECSCAVMSTSIPLPMGRTWIPLSVGLLILSFWSPMFLQGSYCGLSLNYFDNGDINPLFLSNQLLRPVFLAASEPLDFPGIRVLRPGMLQAECWRGHCILLGQNCAIVQLKIYTKDLEKIVV